MTWRWRIEINNKWIATIGGVSEKNIEPWINAWLIKKNIFLNKNSNLKIIRAN